MKRKPARRTTAAADAAEVRRLLTTGTPKLSRANRERIRAASGAAVAPLIEILEDESLALEDGPGLGYAPAHAAELLGELSATDAVEPMLKRLIATTWDEILHNAVVVSLPKIGEAVVEPALALLAQTTDPDVRWSIKDILSEVGVRDERIRDLLLADIEDEPERAAMNLASYGDVSVLPQLRQAFDRHIIKEEGLFANQELIELKGAIEGLGGELTADQAAKFERGMGARARDRLDWDRDDPARGADDGMPVRAEAKLGRNEPCWCGSGRKYKKCHLGADEDRGVEGNTPDPEPAGLELDR
jgi:hypothetical protein